MSEESPKTVPEPDIISNLEAKIKALEEKLTSTLGTKLGELHESVKNMNKVVTPSVIDDTPVNSTVHQYPEEKSIQNPTEYTLKYIQDTIEAVNEKFNTYKDHEMPPVSAGESMVYGMSVGGMTPEQILEALPMKKIN